jgi:hypothetical protein
MASNPRVDEAQAVHDTFTSRVAAIRANDRLSELAKREALAQAWVTAADKLDALRAAYQEDVGGERRDLERKLLRPKVPGLAPTAADRLALDASFRDALDRASSIESSEELVQLLQRSERVGDAVQVRAIVATAVERGDLHVLEAHLEVHPDERADFERLLEMSTGATSRRERLAMSMVFGRPPVPGELGTSDEFAVRRVAEGRSDTEAPTLAGAPAWKAS